MSRIQCTISGSFRKCFEEIASTRDELRQLGIDVLSPRSGEIVDTKGGFVYLKGDTGSPKEIESRHLQSILLSDFLYVVNPDGYVGASATMEIGFALAHSVPIFCSCQPAESVISMYTDVEPSVRHIKGRLNDDPRPCIPPKPDLAALQRYIDKVVRIRGFDEESLRDVVLLFVEEVGELAKAVRKRIGLKTSSKDARKAVSDELADCLIYLLDLANLAGVDLETAMRDKEEANWNKTWVRTPTAASLDSQQSDVTSSAELES